MNVNDVVWVHSTHTRHCAAVLSKTGLFVHNEYIAAIGASKEVDVGMNEKEKTVIIRSGTTFPVKKQQASSKLGIHSKTLTNFLLTHLAESTEDRIVFDANNVTVENGLLILKVDNFNILRGLKE